MQLKKSKKLHYVEIEMPNGLTRHVKIKASNRETAEARALKFNPSAIRVKPNV